MRLHGDIIFAKRQHGYCVTYKNHLLRILSGVGAQRSVGRKKETYNQKCVEFAIFCNFVHNYCDAKTRDFAYHTVFLPFASKKLYQ